MRDVRRPKVLIEPEVSGTDSAIIRRAPLRKWLHTGENVYINAPFDQISEERLKQIVESILGRNVQIRKDDDGLWMDQVRSSWRRPGLSMKLCRTPGRGTNLEFRFGLLPTGQVLLLSSLVLFVLGSALQDWELGIIISVGSLLYLFERLKARKVQRAIPRAIVAEAASMRALDEGPMPLTKRV